MKTFSFTDPYLCFIDPLSAAIGGIIPAIIGGAKSGAPAPTPAPPDAPPPPQATPTGQRQQPRPQQSTFIGASATPPTQSGQKSLLGQ